MLTAVVALLAASGCGPTGSDSSGPIVRPAVTHSTTPSVFPGMTARQIVDRAISATQSVSAVTYDMRVTEDGWTAQDTAAVTRSGECAASMADGENLQVIRTSTMTTYIKGDAAYWRSRSDTQGEAMAHRMAGKWIALSKTEAWGLRDVCSLQETLSQFTDDLGGATFKLGRVVTFAGQQAITIEQTSSGDPSSHLSDLLVATHGTPYILRTFDPGKPSNGISFSHFDQPPHISAPHASGTLDLSEFGNPVFSA